MKYQCIYLFLFINTTKAWLWYTPVSREQMMNDCHQMRENNSPFYPNYCQEYLSETNTKTVPKHQTNQAAPPLINKNTHHPTGEENQEVKPIHKNGWGWSSWGRWIKDACPEICGRRCRSRTRYCFGPFAVSCKGHGSEYDNCPRKDISSNWNTETDSGGGGGSFGNSPPEPIHNQNKQTPEPSWLSPNIITQIGGRDTQYTNNRDPQLTPQLNEVRPQNNVLMATSPIPPMSNNGNKNSNRRDRRRVFKKRPLKKTNTT